MQDLSKLPLLTAVDPGRTPGLIWAYAALPGQRASHLASIDIVDALARPAGWVWLHLDVLDQRAIVWLQRLITLPDSARSMIEDHSTAVGLAFDDGYVHGATVDFHHESTGDETSLGTVLFVVSDRLLITARRQALTSLARLRHALDDGAVVSDAYDLLSRLVLGFCRTVSLHIAAATQELDRVEDRIVSEYIANDRKQLKAVRRFAVSVHRPIAALVTLFEDDEREEWEISQQGHAVLHRLAARLAAIDREVQTTNDRARLLQEEMAAELADDSNRSLRVLTIVSALLMPCTLVTGLFGMNTGGLPFATSPHGFWGAVVVGCLATGLFYWLIRRAGAGLRF